MQNKKKKDTKLPRKSTYILYSLKKELSSVLFPYDVQIAKSFFQYISFDHNKLDDNWTKLKD